MFRRRFGPGRGPWQPDYSDQEQPTPEEFPFDMPPHMRLRWARKMMREGGFGHGHHGHPMHFGHHRGPGAWFAPDDGEPFDRMFGRGPRGGGPFGGGPRGPGGPFGGRQRQRRGDIKFALLELLAEQPRHGYELIKELEQRYGGFYRPSPGSVYPTLQLLEDEGHLTSETVEGKRVYTITDSGRALLSERQQSQPEHGGHPGFRGPGPELEGLRQSGMGLVASVMQAARHGTPEQKQAVMKLLDSTRREIYAILSRDEKDDTAGE